MPRMPTKTKTYRFGEFFAGPGGMSLGATWAEVFFGCDSEHRAVLEPVWAVDRDADSCRTYARNIHGADARVFGPGDTDRPGIDREMSPIETAVINASVDEINPTLLSKVDVFLFGFPCNDFSLAGERKGLTGEYGGLYMHAVRYLEEHMPTVFVAENVTGLMSANDYRAFHEIMETLRMGGKYRVVPHLYKFEEYGVAQTRHRVILVGMRIDQVDVGGKLREFRPPAPTTKDNPVSAFAALSLADLDEPSPLVKEPGGHVSRFPNHVHKKVSPEVSERLRLTGEGENVWDVNHRLPDHLKLAVKGTFISSIYKVLDRSKPAYTVVGNGGGGTHMYHWDRRPTTDRERAVFQSFPTTFEFLGNVASVRKQIGMAVPPLGACQIIESVLKTLHDVGYDSVESNVIEKNLDQVEAAERKRQQAKLSAPKDAETAEQEELRRKELEAIRQRRKLAREQIAMAKKTAGEVLSGGWDVTVVREPQLTEARQLQAA